MNVRRSPLRATLVLVVLTVVLTACTAGDGGDGGDGAAARVGGEPAAAGEEAAMAAVLPPSGHQGAALENTITVSGTGRITGVPDTLRATIGVQVLRPQVQEALDQANATQEQVLAALEDAGVAEDDISTTQFSVEPQYRYTENEPPTITGYVVTNLVEAKLRDLDRVGEILSAAVTAGGDAARVQGVSFALEDNAELLAEARRAAYADALAKAQQYAAAAGVDLGALVALTEVNANLPQPLAMEERAAAQDAAGGAVPIRPGSQEVAVTITASWRL